jgi:zinc transport system substrate-binding protein
MGSKIKVIIISIVVSLLIFYSIIEIGIKINPRSAKNENDLKIVTTIFPYYDFARAVVGDDNNIELLIKPGAELHSYEPTPADIIKIQNADVFIYNGGENDEWVENILATLDMSNVTVLKMMDYVEIYEEDDEWILNEEKEEEIGYDEHIWTSPRNAIKLVETISKTLVDLNNEKSEVYTTNSQNYIEEINNIDNQIKEIVDNSQNKLLIFGDRFPFRYLIEEFHLKYRAAFAGCSSESEPSASTITNLIETIRENNVPVVLYIELSNEKVANIIAEETGIKTMCLNSCQGISKSDFDNGETYVSIMKKNIETLKMAL